MQECLARGLSRAVVGRELNLVIQTVRCFADAVSVEELLARAEHRATRLHPWRDVVNQRRNAGVTNAQDITAELRVLGFTPSPDRPPLPAATAYTRRRPQARPRKIRADHPGDSQTTPGQPLDAHPPPTTSTRTMHSVAAEVSCEIACRYVSRAPAGCNSSGECHRQARAPRAARRSREGPTGGARQQLSVVCS